MALSGAAAAAPLGHSRRCSSHGLVDTERLAAALAPQLVPGQSVWLRGELGAGKTAFVRAAAAALGVAGSVTSPTYTVGNRYRGTAADVSHLDLYRSSGLTEEEWGDLEPYFDDAVVFVEWPDAGARLLPPPHMIVDIDFVSADARLITVSCDDPGPLNALAAACS